MKGVVHLDTLNVLALGKPSKGEEFPNDLLTIIFVEIIHLAAGDE